MAIEERLLRLESVRELTGLSKSSIYSLADFPKPVKIGQRASAWPASAVQRWIAERIAKARPQSGTVATEAEADVEEATVRRQKSGRGRV